LSPSYARMHVAMAVRGDIKNIMRRSTHLM
jgi:hypothetical protein